MIHVYKAPVAESDVGAFVGDPRQLPPIGPGKPFQDAIAAGGVPTTRLTKNWRTDCQGIRQLCDDMLTLDQDALRQQGVTLWPCRPYADQEWIK